MPKVDRLLQSPPWRQRQACSTSSANGSSRQDVRSVSPLPLTRSPKNLRSPSGSPVTAAAAALDCCGSSPSRAVSCRTASPSGAAPPAQPRSWRETSTFEAVRSFASRDVSPRTSHKATAAAAAALPVRTRLSPTSGTEARGRFDGDRIPAFGLPPDTGSGSSLTGGILDASEGKVSPVSPMVRYLDDLMQAPRSSPTCGHSGLPSTASSRRHVTAAGLKDSANLRRHDTTSPGPSRRHPIVEALARANALP